MLYSNSKEREKRGKNINKKKRKIRESRIIKKIEKQ